MTARIYQLDGAFPVWLWLCAEHLAARIAKGWAVKQDKDPPHPLTCDDCKRREAAT